MTEIDDFQARITAALDRIAKGVDRIPVATGVKPTAPEPVAKSGEVEKLRAALADEKAANAQLTERLRAVKDRDGQTVHALEARVDVMTRQLDVQGLEMQRLRKTTAQLRDQVRVLHEAAAAGTVDAAMINKAMLVELEALRAIRASESAELEEILSELTPLVRAEVLDA
jgi:predicted  nucleic acid-binding Zn-ribbon protein